MEERQVLRGFISVEEPTAANTNNRYLLREAVGI